MCKLCDKIYTVFERAPELDEHYFQDPEENTISFVTYYYDAISDQFHPVLHILPTVSVVGIS